jgi:YbbR domain-containing protein
MNKFLNIFFVIMIMASFLALFEWTVINWLLGCETWNKDLWTYEHSCMTFGQMIGISPW